MSERSTTLLETAHEFTSRHIGPSAEEKARMLHELGFGAMDDFIAKAVPPSIRLKKTLSLPAGWDEHSVLTELRAIAAKNQVFRSYIGMG
jgi:glycine dehydrogenase